MFGSGGANAPGAGRGPTSKANTEQAVLMMERQNDDGIGDLHKSIRTIHALSVDVREEVLEQNAQLDELDDAMDQSKGMLSGTMQRLAMDTAGGLRQFWCLVALAVIMLGTCYWIAEHRGTDGT